ncbi:hypothetical protein BAL199_05574 [alpha proteobacterium BAL199]|nr:hypothetical protein BAL199_05574 [alpha proteobacterium BAL199]
MLTAPPDDADGVAKAEGVDGLADDGDGLNGDGAVGAVGPAAARSSSWSMVNTRV